MRLGLIADIHGNVPALQAVLAELERDGVDRIVCLGDVAIGPQPTETTELIRSLDCDVVRGNWDEYFVDGFPEPQTELSRRLFDMGAWAAEIMAPHVLEYLRGLELLELVELTPEVRLLAFHGSPRSTEDWIVATTADDEVARMLTGFEAPLLAGGHTHFQLVRRLGDSVFVNPGSVGLPFRRPAPVMDICPWAEYGIVDAADGRLSVELRRTAFDVEELRHIILASGMPHAAWWADRWITAEPAAARAADA